MDNLNILNLTKEQKDVIVLMYNSFMKKQKGKFNFSNVCKRFDYNIKDKFKYDDKIKDYFFFFNYRSFIKLIDDKVYYQNEFFINLFRGKEINYYLFNTDRNNLSLNIKEFISDLKIKIIIENPKLYLSGDCYFINIDYYYTYYDDYDYQSSFPGILKKLYKKNADKIWSK